MSAFAASSPLTRAMAIARSTTSLNGEFLSVGGRRLHDAEKSSVLVAPCRSSVALSYGVGAGDDPWNQRPRLSFVIDRSLERSESFGC
jgi:hypothetical protein